MEQFHWTIEFNRLLHRMFQRFVRFRSNWWVQTRHFCPFLWVVIFVVQCRHHFLLFSDSNIWSREICVPETKDIPYRYLVCTIEPMTENIHVRRWETHLVPRLISAYIHDGIVANDTTVPLSASASTSVRSETRNDIDTFGDIAGVEKIDRGWLTTETVFQFKFVRNPFMLKQKLKNRLLYVKVRNLFW